jgi:hypothetical protein
MLANMGSTAFAQDKDKDKDKERMLVVTMKTPSSAYKIMIEEVYQTPKELWVLSRVEGKGVGLAVIKTVTDQVKVKAPADLPVKVFVLGKTWNWGDEKYTFLKDRTDFDKMIKKEMGMKIFQRPMAAGPVGTSLYIIMYKKEIFTNGKTKDGETLEQLAKRHAKEYKGQVNSILQIINGCSMHLSPESAEKLGKLPEVKLVEKDAPIGIN